MKNSSVDLDTVIQITTFDNDIMFSHGCANQLPLALITADVTIRSVRDAHNNTSFAQEASLVDRLGNLLPSKQQNC